LKAGEREKKQSGRKIGPDNRCQKLWKQATSGAEFFIKSKDESESPARRSGIFYL
jgi:hypothetical protein